MLDFSDYTVSNRNVENITDKIKEKSSKKINTVWLGTQKYEPIFNLQKIFVWVSKEREGTHGSSSVPAELQPVR